MDSIVTSIIKKFETRAIQGKKKYGTDLDRTDLNVGDWIEHTQDELMDAILYLEKLKNTPASPIYYKEYTEISNTPRELNEPVVKSPFKEFYENKRVNYGKPVTPYIQFFDTQFAKIAFENPGMSYNEIGKLIDEMWKSQSM